MKLETLKISVSLLESMRSNSITVLTGLLLLYVYLMKGKGTQTDFAKRHSCSRQQINVLFLSLLQDKLIVCDVHFAAKGQKITEAFKFYTLTDKGKDLVNQLLSRQ